MEQGEVVFSWALCNLLPGTAVSGQTAAMNDPRHLIPLLLLFIPIFWGIYGFFKTKRQIRNKISYPSSATDKAFNDTTHYAWSSTL